MRRSRLHAPARKPDARSAAFAKGESAEQPGENSAQKSDKSKILNRL